MMTGYKKIFIDTAPFIYYLENNPQYFDVMKKFLLNCITNNIKLITSTVTIEEYLVYPFRIANEEMSNNFLTFLADLKIEIMYITKEIAINAAKYRSIYPTLRSMDALQISACELTECEMFLTNDVRLKKVKEINCKVVNDLN